MYKVNAYGEPRLDKMKPFDRESWLMIKGAVEKGDFSEFPTIMSVYADRGWLSEVHRGYTIYRVDGGEFFWSDPETYEAEFDGESWITPADSGHGNTIEECKTAIDEYLD